jgi:hypothetical protein
LNLSLKHGRKAPHQKPANGNRPDQGRRYSSKSIMAFAGQKGFTSLRQSRKLCGYRHGTPSKYTPHDGAKQRSGHNG